MNEVYTLADAIQSIKASKKRNFDESIDVTIKIHGGAKTKDGISLGGSVRAPYSLNKNQVIAVFAETDVQGADYVGGQSLIDKFKQGKALARKCDVCVSKPEYMKKVSSELGKLLGRRRLIPDAKMGTVSDDVQQVVNNFRHGVMTFRANKNIIHSSFGKVSFESEHLADNLGALMSAVESLLPSNASITDVFVSSTMGKSRKVALQRGKVVFA